MATYALIANDKIVNLVNADSEADLGVTANIYDVKDVSGLDPQPSVGWGVSGDTFIAPKVNLVAAANWNGAGFDAPKSSSDDSKGK